MSQTLTELYNIAGQTIGLRGKLVSTTERNRPTEVFNLHYPFVRARVLGAAHWGSCKRSVRLSLAAERTGTDWAEGDPMPGWQYAYHLPSGHLHPRFLTTGNRFEMGIVGNTKCLNTNEESPVYQYTWDNEDLGTYEPELFFCLALALAAQSANALTGKPQLAQQVMQQANAIIITTRTNAANENMAPIDTVASWHAARGYEGRQSQIRYVFPYAPLLTQGETVGVK